MEIDENLARSELTPAEESAYILRRKVVWEEINGSVGAKILHTNELRADGRRKGEQHLKQFAAEISEVTGSSKRDVQLKIARARELGPDITRIVGTSLDKGVEMDALIKLRPFLPLTLLREPRQVTDSTNYRVMPTMPNLAAGLHYEWAWVFSYQQR